MSTVVVLLLLAGMWYFIYRQFDKEKEVEVKVKTEEIPQSVAPEFTSLPILVDNSVANTTSKAKKPKNKTAKKSSKNKKRSKR